MCDDCLTAFSMAAILAADRQKMLAYQTDIFTRHGRRARESVKDWYVQYSLSSLLLVSKALGI